MCRTVDPNTLTSYVQNRWLHVSLSGVLCSYNASLTSGSCWVQMFRISPMLGSGQSSFIFHWEVRQPHCYIYFFMTDFLSLPSSGIFVLYYLFWVELVSWWGRGAGEEWGGGEEWGECWIGVVGTLELRGRERGIVVEVCEVENTTNHLTSQMLKGEGIATWFCGSNESHRVTFTLSVKLCGVHTSMKV